MQPSMFNLRVPLTTSGDFFLMNTLTDAQLVVSADVAELLPIVRDWGYDVDAGTFADEGVHGRLGTGRIFAADVIPAVTMTFGGIEIDSSCRALDANGKPIAGLFAAGGDASDIYHRGYGGGLCAAAVTGRGAGTKAAELAKARA